MSICNAQLSLDDIIAEYAKTGSPLEIDTLAEDQATAVSASIIQYTDQELDEVTDDGVGIFGLSEEKLQDVGVVKQGINTVGTLPTILADPSVFTGKYGVTKIEDLFISEPVQRLLAQDAIAVTLIKLTQQGALTGEETDEEIAEVAALSAKFSVSDIKSFLDGTGPEALLATMGVLAAAASYAMKLLKQKKTDPSAKLPGLPKLSNVAEQATDTIKTPALDAELDKFIGSKRIESAQKAAEPATNDIKDIF